MAKTTDNTRKEGVAAKQNENDIQNERAKAQEPITIQMKTCWGKVQNSCLNPSDRPYEERTKAYELLQKSLLNKEEEVTNICARRLEC